MKTLKANELETVTGAVAPLVWILVAGILILTAPKAHAPTTSSNSSGG
ncbi:MAG: hypothetical protein HRU38_16320 [Saccharospirillaceae bacterium]|nr:hypothetical protein [Saccharospirillaceae bacterium]